MSIFLCQPILFIQKFINFQYSHYFLLVLNLDFERWKWMDLLISIDWSKFSLNNDSVSEMIATKLSNGFNLMSFQLSVPYNVDTRHISIKTKWKFWRYLRFFFCRWQNSRKRFVLVEFVCTFCLYYYEKLCGGDDSQWTQPKA